MLHQRRRDHIDDNLVAQLGSGVWSPTRIESKTRIHEQWFDILIESTSVIHVNIDMRKFPEHLHWQYGASVLGTDEHGTWLHVPTGTMARRGEEPPRKLEMGFIGLVPSDGQWWMAEFYLSHPWHLVYVNIGTPPEWDGDRIYQVDLDLDVVLTPDGSIQVLDEDDFALNQVRYGYPADLIAVGSALHWFDQTRFLAEASRVATPGAWLVIYDHWFTGEMQDRPEFGTWTRDVYLRAYPAPPRDRSWQPPADLGHWRHVAWRQYDHPVDFTIDEMASYLLTQSNLQTVIERGDQTEDELRTRLRTEIAPLFNRNRSRTFLFGGFVACHRRSS